MLIYSVDYITGLIFSLKWLKYQKKEYYYEKNN